MQYKQRGSNIRIQILIKAMKVRKAYKQKLKGEEKQALIAKI